MVGIATLREQLQGAGSLLESTMDGVTREQAHWQPHGTANPIGANYAHAVLSVDMTVHALLQGKPQLASGEWAARTGLSELPPGEGAPGAWGEWARRVQIELPALRTFAQAILAAADAHLSSLDDAALSRAVDLSAMGFGQPTVAWLLGTVIQNVNLHCGEISCLKGLQGLPGYPI